MPNAANINRLIEWMREDNARHFRMENWFTDLKTEAHTTEYHHCSTAFCLGGYISALKQIDAGVDKTKIQIKRSEVNPNTNTVSVPFEDYVSEGAEFLGISHYQADKLFMMGGTDATREDFDQLPDSDREAVGISVLEHLRDTGEVDWNGALEANGIDPYELRDEDEYEGDDYDDY